MQSTNIRGAVGRPKYQPDIEQLKELFKQVADKKITNEERMEDCKM